MPQIYTLAIDVSSVSDDKIQSDLFERRMYVFKEDFIVLTPKLNCVTFKLFLHVIFTLNLGKWNTLACCDERRWCCASWCTIILRETKYISLKFLNPLLNSASEFQIVWACLLSGHKVTAQWFFSSKAFHCLHFSKENYIQSAKITKAKLLAKLVAILSSAFQCTSQADSLLVQMCVTIIWPPPSPKTSSPSLNPSKIPFLWSCRRWKLSFLSIWEHQASFSPQTSDRFM